MSEHDEGRRSFLIKSAAGVGAVAGATLPGDALARHRHRRRADESNTHEKKADSAGARPAAVKASSEHRGLFLSEDEYAAVAAFAERLMPAASGKAGAKDAGVADYIDSALAGAYNDQQEFYRHGLAALDAASNARFKENFVYLKPDQQDALIGALEEGKAPEFTWPPAQAFFNTLRLHTMEGMFCDPVYGGNKNFAGWKLVGFPGAQRLYTQAELQSADAFKRPTIGLQSVEAATKSRG